MPVTVLDDNDNLFIGSQVGGRSIYCGSGGGGAIYTPDGQAIVFSTFQGDLVPGDDANSEDFVRFDIATGHYSFLMRGVGDLGGYFGCLLSPDGQNILFRTAASLDFQDTNQTIDIYTLSLLTGDVRLVSSTSDGGSGNGISWDAVFSPDGRFVLFQSEASNLVAGDSNGVADIFLKNLVTGEISRVSLDDLGQQLRLKSYIASVVSYTPNGPYDPDPYSGHSYSTLAQGTFSPNGQNVLFSTGQPLLASERGSDRPDYYIRNLATGALSLVASRADGKAGDLGSAFAAFAPDGQSVVFTSESTNLVPGIPKTAYITGSVNLFEKDLVTGEIVLLSRDERGMPKNSSGGMFVISPDGNYVASIEILYDNQQPYSSLHVYDRNTGLEFESVQDVTSVSWRPDSAAVIYHIGRSVIENSLDMLNATGIDVVFGEAGNDVIYGLSGDDNLLGDNGDDVLDGGPGQDFLQGGRGDDIMRGQDGADTLDGYDGNDSLDGGAGVDWMTGGRGNDIYGVENARDVVVENAGEGIDTVKTNLDDYVLGANLENLTLTGSADISGTGNDANNIMIGNGGNNTLLGGKGDDQLYGGAGDDILNSGTGADRMYGGAGDDIYYYGVGDTIIEAADAGIDTVYASVNFTLGSTLEDLVLIGDRAINANGNNLDNRLEGNGAANVLQGGRGADVLLGMGGDDVLVGGRDGDTLTGGAGADTFRYLVPTDSLKTASDIITDYEAGTDRLDLSALDADTTVDGDQAFHQVDAFTGHAGELTVSYDGGTNRTTLSLDMNGDGQADMAILFLGQVTSSAGWLL